VIFRRFFAIFRSFFSVGLPLEEA